MLYEGHKAFKAYNTRSWPRLWQSACSRCLRKEFGTPQSFQFQRKSGVSNNMEFIWNQVINYASSFSLHTLNDRGKCQGNYVSDRHGKKNG